MYNAKLQISGINRYSVTDGPGLRLTLFYQGCPHKCVQCHNASTHNPKGGYTTTLTTLMETIAQTRDIDGVTFSGGEPFLQADKAALLARWIKKQGLNLLVYTGYYYEELTQLALTDRGVNKLLRYTDTLIDGPFEVEKQTGECPFRGSSNQRLLDLSGHREAGRMHEA